MDRPLSFSGYKRYVTCPQFYKYHDIEKLRPGKSTSALVFGSMIEGPIESLLLKNPVAILQHIDQKTAENKLLDIEFYEADFDADFLNIEELEAFAQNLGWKGDNIVTAIKDMLKAQDNLTANQRKLLNHAVWECLRIKARAMVSSFTQWILPQIKEVHEMQSTIQNADNSITGKLDFVVTMNDGRKVLFDLKTSARNYNANAVLESPQLMLYAALYGIKYAGFIVLSKTLSKNKVKTCPSCSHSETGGNKTKCPKCSTKMDYVVTPTSYSQLLIEKVPEGYKALTLETMQTTIGCINKGVFTKNLTQCFNMYGKSCPYVSECWKGE